MWHNFCQRKETDDRATMDMAHIFHSRIMRSSFGYSADDAFAAVCVPIIVGVAVVVDRDDFWLLLAEAGKTFT